MDKRKDGSVGGIDMDAADRGEKKNFVLSAVGALGTAASKYISAYLERRERGANSKAYGIGRVLRGIGFGLLGTLFGRAVMVFSTYPIGAGLLAASGADAPYIYAGLLISVLFAKEQSFPLFLVYTLGIIIRFVVSKYLSEGESRGKTKEDGIGSGAVNSLKKLFGQTGMFAEPIGWRCACAAIMAFVYGMYRCVAGGFLYYDFFASLVSLGAMPAAAFIYGCALEPGERFSELHDVGSAALLASTVYSLSGISVFGFSLSAVAAFVITLYTSRECGTLRGGVVGLCCGMAYNFLYCPVFAFAGLLAGLFRRVGAWAAALAGAAVAAACGVYLGGFDSLRLFAPDILAASIVFCPLDQLDLLPKLKLYSHKTEMPKRTADEAAIAKIRTERTADTINEYSEAFTSLSELFYKLSEKLKQPDGCSIRSALEKVIEERCGDCPKKGSCWDEDFERTSRAMNLLAERLREGGLLRREDIREPVRSACGSTDDIIADLNAAYSDILRRSFNENRTEIFAMDYETTSKLLRSAAQSNMIEYEINDGMTARMKSVAKYLNFNLNNIIAYGKRRINIVAGGVDLSRVRLTGEEIRRSFERACGVRLDDPEFSMESDYITMSLTQARIFSVSRAVSVRTKKDENVNGDTTAVFENKNDYFYSIISDGMGSGRDAALCSKLCCVFLEKMLRCGNSKAVSVEMLNNFLRNNNTSAEAFTTIDLFEADLLSGKATFVKAGAPASFVVREGSLFKIESKTLPVGVTSEINAQEIKLGLRPDDMIVMISDGIAQSFDDGMWLADLLTGEKCSRMSIKEIADSIVERAVDHNPRPDDMTAVVMRMDRV